MILRIIPQTVYTAIIDSGAQAGRRVEGRWKLNIFAINSLIYKIAVLGQATPLVKTFLISSLHRLDFLQLQNKKTNICTA